MLSSMHLCWRAGRFSVMKFLKNAQRNRLKAVYVSAAARIFRSRVGVDKIDFVRMLKKWYQMRPMCVHQADIHSTIYVHVIVISLYCLSTYNT